MDAGSDRGFGDCYCWCGHFFSLLFEIGGARECALSESVEDGG